MSCGINVTFIIIAATTILILNEASGVIYTLISKGRTLRNVAPYKTADAVNYHVCISRCRYDRECLSFDFTPDSQLGRCNFYDVSFVMGDQTLQLVNKPGTSFYSALPRRGCTDWFKQGFTQNGVYEIMVFGKHKLRVYCNMEEDGGGWIVFQRRFDGSVPFNRTWDEYRRGFGDVSGEHWLGNKWLNLLTKSEKYDYYVVATDFQGVKAKKKMLGVTVENEELKYRLKFEQEGQGPQYGEYMNGMNFSTIHQDNDRSVVSCSSNYGGAGWWFNSCHRENMNGPYCHVQTESTNCMIWYFWKNKYESLKETSLMIRPRSFTQL